MPTPKEHREWARRNYRIYDRLGGNDADGDAAPWALTILFYVAVHEIKAILERDRARLSGAGFAVPISHEDRKVVLAKLYGKVAPMYSTFMDWSRQARYECFVPSRDDLQRAEELLERIRTQLRKYRAAK